MARHLGSGFRIAAGRGTPLRQFIRWASFLALVTVVSTSLILGQSASPARFDDVSARASAAWNSSQFEEAVRLYRQAVQLKPTWAEGWGYLAASLFTLKRYPEARDAYRRTTVLTPKNGPSWAYTGLCEFELRDYRHAFDDLSKSERLGLGPDLSLQARVKYRLAVLWNTAGQFDLGLKEIAWFADQNQPTPDAIQATGLSVLRMPLFPYEIPANKTDLVMKAGHAGWEMNSHHLEESRKLYADLAAAYPTEPNVHYAYGYLLALLDQEEAVKQFEKELELSPSHVPAMVQASFLYLKLGQLDASRELALRAMKIEPRNYAPHNILGRILVEEKKYAAGIQELEIAGRLAPGHPGNHFNLAQAYQRAGRKADATREFAAFEKLNRQAGAQAAGAAAVKSE